MGVEEELPSGLLLITVEKMGGYARKSSVPPASSGLACCAVELFQASGPGHRHHRFLLGQFHRLRYSTRLLACASDPEGWQGW
jgi:NADH-quinone oxidoreductase subunit B